MVVDGQDYCFLEEGDRVSVKKDDSRTVKLVHNPATSYWETLVRKMHWAAAPGGV